MIPRPLHPRPMQHPVDHWSTHRSTQLRMRGFERRPKPLKIRPPAFRAGPVTGGQGNSLVGEEKLGVAARRHQFTPAPLEAQCARDPGVMPPAGRTQPVLVIMQDAAIAHQRAAGWMRADFAGRSDAVLKWEGAGHAGRLARPAAPANPLLASPDNVAATIAIHSQEQTNPFTSGGVAREIA